MKTFEDIAALRHALGSCRGDRIALVPTMGCLHEGHLSLINKAKRLADTVVVSIYVNPLQFAAGEDLSRYPRPFERDLEQCHEAGVDMVFHPPTLYPHGEPKIRLHVEELSDCLCGHHRPGHFDGMVTVVNLLFNIVQPDMAVFGEKDWQQLTIIRRMVSDLHMPVDIVSASTVREADGLAMSSRNRYLQATERQQATILYQTLLQLQTAYSKGIRETQQLLSMGEQALQQAGLTAEYLTLCDEYSLQPNDTAEEHSRLFIACRIGTARLIDNIRLGVPQQAR